MNIYKAELSIKIWDYRQTYLQHSKVLTLYKKLKHFLISFSSGVIINFEVQGWNVKFLGNCDDKVRLHNLIDDLLTGPCRDLWRGRCSKLKGGTWSPNLKPHAETYLAI